MRQGSGYLGSKQIETSIAGKEILPDAPEGWTNGYSLIRFQIRNDQSCTFLINDTTKVFSRSGEGFIMGQKDPEITSVRILEDEVTYNWAGVY